MSNLHCSEGLIIRLNKLEGQVRGIKDMLLTGNKCEDILIQISAASSALNGVAKIIISDHIKHCVVDGIKNGEENAVDNLEKAIQQFINLK